ncbi:MAG TPA: class I SAM-dependent methyltransferase [Bacteroidia bacterium]|nr:class I SAM-dependent methyltransferase [Bacteroidia bacterium]
MENTSRLKKGFNFLAPFYETGIRFFFGKNIFRSQVFFLPGKNSCPNALIFGGGSGELLLEMVRRQTASNIYYIDISEKMISLAQERIMNKASEFQNSIHFICGTVSDIPPGIRFDLIITPYVLDCFEEQDLPEVMKSLSKTLNEKGIWLFSDFDIPESGLWKVFATAIIFILYVFFSLCCGLKQKRLAGFRTLFQTLPLDMVAEKKFCRGLLIARMYRLRQPGYIGGASYLPG